jgi:hypothetical protein
VIVGASDAKGETAVSKAQQVRSVQRAEVEALLARVDAGRVQYSELALVVVRASRSAGRITLTVSESGLAGSSVLIETGRAASRPVLKRRR